MRNLKIGKYSSYIELFLYSLRWIVCCLSGCLNGGGQVKPSPSQNQKDLLHQVEELYKAELPLLPENDTRVAELYETWLRTLGEERAKELLHTKYHAVEKMTNGLTIKWWSMLLTSQDDVCRFFILNSASVLAEMQSKGFFV